MTLRRAHANFRRYLTNAGRYSSQSNILNALRALVFAALCTTLGIAFADFSKAGSNSLQFASARVLTAPKAGVAEDRFRALLNARGARGVERLSGTDIYVVEVSAGSELDHVAKLALDADVQFAELDALAPPAASSAAVSTARAWHLQKIDAPSAWGASTGAGIDIAILDSGVDQAHPDLANKTLRGRSFVGNVDDTTDLTGRGTAVAGAAAATGGGVARGARILPVRVADDTGAHWSAVARGLIWAADQGAKVASIGYEGLSASRSVLAAARYFVSKGGVVVVAAGDSGSVDDTALTDAMIVVSATDADDQITSWSTFGAFVGLSAPGQNVLTTTAGGGYRAWSGTSMAASMVAGTAALVLADRPDLTAADIRHALLASAIDLGPPGWDAHYGAGRVNALGAIGISRTEPLRASAKESSVAASPVTCVRGNPTVAIAPSGNGSAAAGSKLAFTVTLTDNDVGPCSVARFLLTETHPSGWSATIDPSVISLSPGASASTSLFVSSPSSASAGAYPVTVSAMHGNSPKPKAGSASASYVVADGGSAAAQGFAAAKPPCKKACSPPITTPILPGAPTIGTAVAGDAQATVSFTAPASDGGSPITSYTVTSNPGGIAATGSGSPITVTGLTNGTSYKFTVTATNGVGTGRPSAASNAVKPTATAGVPGAPTIGVATAGNAQATVSFTVPASNGGSAITGYKVTSSPGGITATSAGSPITVTGLANGTSYTFTVQAINAVGTGAASAASNAVTPTAPPGVPGAPTIGVATAGNAQATVSFTAPAANGGSAITGYKVTSSPTGITATSTGSPIIVTGLTNGVSHTFTVQAINAVGAGPPSSASNAVTPTAPATVPGAPTIGLAVAGNAQAAVNFTAPASNGGSAITSYKVTSSPGGVTATGTTSAIVVTGLTNGVSYTFTVQAINGVGTGPSSAASNAATPAAPSGGGNSYSTSFPNTENPISEGGRWTNGKAIGLDWQNVRTTAGFAFFAAPNPGSYDDATAILTGAWGPDQYVRTVVRIPQSDPIYAQEIEIRLRSNITPHSSTGYEVLGGTQIVRWNGPLGDFTTLPTQGSGGTLRDGDIFQAQMVGNVITVFINGVQVMQAIDNTFTTGNPGMGFFTRNPSAAPFGFSSFTAWN